MQQLYEAKGLLSREFIGQITYTFCLTDPLEELDICLAFDKQHYESPSQVPVEELVDYCRLRYNTSAYEAMSREQLAELFFRETKTEIHISAFLNDEFIGCIHKQLTCRHMHFGPGELSQGCIMPERLEGVLKVTVLVFQVLLDDTPYTVTIKGKKLENCKEVEQKMITKAETAEAESDIAKTEADAPETKNTKTKSPQKFLRLELHNHTTESDASLSCQDLLDHMAADGVDAFALTDHNTISGHPKMKALLEETPNSIQCIYGMEYTTYYGHILCLNLRAYVPWDSIDPRRPELIFRKIRSTGALAGIAHPFSYGYPFATGCRFEMQMTDYSDVDFIEIFNNPEPLKEVNEPDLLLWEKLVLAGWHIAVTCGMDLHGKWKLAGNYATFVQDRGLPASEALDLAVRERCTWVSKGPLLAAENLPEQRCTVFRILDGGKPGCPVDPGKTYLMTLRLSGGTIEERISPDSPLSIPWEKFAHLAALDLGDSGAGISDPLCPVIPKLYEETSEPESLLCVSPVLYLPLTARQTTSPTAVTASHPATVAPHPNPSTIRPMEKVETAVPR